MGPGASSAGPAPAGAGIPASSPHTERRPAFQVAPGEVRSDRVEAGVREGNISVHVHVEQGVIDVYVLESAVSDLIVDPGGLRLDRPFSYLAEWTRLGVTGNTTIRLPAGGSYDIVLDNSDAYYGNDTQPDGEVALVRLNVRYPEEQPSLLLGTLAAIPSVLLVLFTLVRSIRRWRRNRQAWRAQ